MSEVSVSGVSGKSLLIYVQRLHVNCTDRVLSWNACGVETAKLPNFNVHCQTNTFEICQYL